MRKLLFILFVISFPVKAMGEVSYSTSKIKVLRNELPEFSIKDLLLTTSDDWDELQDNQVLLGMGEDQSWFAIDVQNHLSDKQEMVLYFDKSNIDAVGFHQTSYGSVVKNLVSGDTVPFENRPMDSHLIAFPFELVAHEAQRIYLRVETSGVC